MPGRCMSASNRRQVLTGGAIAVGGLAWPGGPAAGWHAHYWEPLEKILAAGRINHRPWAREGKP